MGDEQAGCDHADCNREASTVVTFIAGVGFYCFPHARLARRAFRTYGYATLPESEGNLGG